MSSTPCKSLKRDGTPCRGNGLDQLDGYCIAHAPADKAWEWRSRGGKASSAAARADKRIPDRLSHAIDKVSRGMDQVLEGKLEPAALSAISRAAKVLIELYRLADQEMDLIRSEETAAAAAQVAGAAGDPELLDAAAAIAAWQDQYRIDALIDQGLVAPEPVETKGKNQPPAHVLTAAGRQRFGYQRLTKHTRKDIDVCRELVIDNPPEGNDLNVALYDLYFIRKNLNELLTDCAPASPPVVDALTGQPLSWLPAAVIPATVPIVGPGQAEQAAADLQDLLRHANQLTREAEILYEKRVGFAYDYAGEREEEEEEENANKPADLEALRRLASLWSEDGSSP